MKATQWFHRPTRIPLRPLARIPELFAAPDNQIRCPMSHFYVNVMFHPGRSVPADLIVFLVTTTLSAVGALLLPLIG